MRRPDPTTVKADPRAVALVVYDGVTMFELGVACQVFGVEPERRPGSDWYELTVCGARSSVTTDAGLRMQVPARLDALERAGTIVVPPCEARDRAAPTVLAGLARAHARGARIVSLCTGAFLLAAAGLLDGRRVTTHWLECEELRSRYPAVTVDPSVLYVDGGDILTSAGSAASIDLCLHVVATDHGAEVANELSRELVVSPHRQGGQAQYIDAPFPQRPDHDLFAETLVWAERHLEQPLTVATLAARAAMSPRTFARRFVAHTGTTPHQWLIARRLRRAQRLLETTDLAVETIAHEAGFPDVTTLRKQFRGTLRTTPTGYRQSFRRERAPLADAA